MDLVSPPPNNTSYSSPTTPTTPITTTAANAANTSSSPSSSSTPSRYENQKRRDWNTFCQYLRNHRPPLSLPMCSGAHVLEFLRYLDQFGKTKVHNQTCPFFGLPNPPAPCPCPLRQAWGSLDALIGRLRAAYEEHGPAMVICIRLFLLLSWRRFDANKLKRHEIAVLEQAVDVYTSEFERFIKFISEVFANSPFFISAEVAGALETGKNDEYKEISVAAGKNYEVSFTVDSVNSYIAWDFSLVQGKMSMDIGFSVECTNLSGEKTLILPYRRYESDQGNFCTCVVGNYKLIWDNSYSAFFKKVLRYKVDCIPPVVEPAQSKTEVE